MSLYSLPENQILSPASRRKIIEVSEVRTNPGKAELVDYRTLGALHQFGAALSMVPILVRWADTAMDIHGLQWSVELDHSLATLK